ncbi:Envelope fusion protein-like [Cinara cedri]|uniref:Envelope fusion protein-like n=1 Tax=Cinara cedri TaxID=506608 RepID=A0A5E4MI36_9HEMI|nr:Envelope fusion protein-like [Cinara cedri]
MANALYGMCSKIDTGFIVNKIIEWGLGKLENLNLIQDRSRITKAEINEGSHALQQIAEIHTKVKKNLQYLQQETNKHTQNIDIIMFKTKLLEQEVLFETLLNKYTFETQNLVSIVNAALDGKVHTNVIFSQKLLTELRKIKMILPMGSELPVEFNVESLPELLRISRISIFTQDTYLVFVIEIPLISKEEYNVYHPIPSLIQYKSDTIVLISPKIDYLAMSSDNEKYFTLTVEQWKTCTALKQGKLCTTNQPIHHRLGSRLCEVSLLTNYQTIPETRDFKYIRCDKLIWHRLSETNSWLYFTQPDSSTIICLNPTETIKIEVLGVDRLTIPSFCEFHIGNSIFTSNNKVCRNIQRDMVTEISQNKLLHSIEEILKFKKPQNISNINFI